MPTKKDTAENAVNRAEENTAPKFLIEKLREHSLELFGITLSTFDGATDGMTGEYTVEEIKSHIENWGKKEVK